MRNFRGLLALLIFVWAGWTAVAQERSDTVARVRAYRQAHGAEIIRRFSEMLSIPNVAHDTPQGHADIARNRDYIVKLFAQRGMKTQVLETAKGFPAIYAEYSAPGAQKTVLFYAHYDGQPVVPEKWAAPPFQPTLRKGMLETNAPVIAIADLKSPLPAESSEWRLYGRSTSDDKAPIIGFLTAIDGFRAARIEPTVNLKFILEGEEEQGSPHLGDLLEKYRDLLKSDLMLICDGPAHASGQYQLVYGARGVMGVELTVYGPKRALHSGHYGNWAPNPAIELAHILASMRDTEGRITIEGFYSDVEPTTPREAAVLDSLPDIDKSLRDELQIGRSEGGSKSVMWQIMSPSLNVRGIKAGEVGSSAANAIMTDATASIDFRMVPHQAPEHVRQLVEAHLQKLGYTIFHSVPTKEQRMAHAKVVYLQWEGGYPSYRTSLDSPVGDAVASAMEMAVGKILRVPTLGGSVPMYLFAEKLKTPILLVPIANYDNNQHASNENIRLKNLFDGIDIYAALFTELGPRLK
jgi:acetylornithine deacetylase/succinyl-diaminopimelate desuccinylase-like protein